MRAVRIVAYCWKIVKQYLCNCNLHGVRYLVDDGYSYIERLFWLFACILNWWGCTLMINGIIHDYYSYPIAITAETTYADWETLFPAVGLCITTTNSMKKYFKMYAGTFQAISALLPGIEYTREELDAAYDEMIAGCHLMLRNCSWNNVEFDCCEEFRDLPKTGVGPCIMMNSFLLKDRGRSGIKFMVNRRVPYGDLVLDLVMNKTTQSFAQPKTINVYVFNNYQLPLMTTPPARFRGKMKKGRTTRVIFTVRDVYNADGVRSVDIDRRKCRFPNELMPDVNFSIYSRDACYLKIYTEQMIKLCGCVHFFYASPLGFRSCNSTEMRCLAKYGAEIRALEISRQRCPRDCEGTDVSVEFFEPSSYNKPYGDVARYHIKLLSHPSIRFYRYPVHSQLDIMVSVGSALGLFMGASILSFFEVPYWLLVRRDKLS